MINAALAYLGANSVNALQGKQSLARLDRLYGTAGPGGSAVANGLYIPNSMQALSGQANAAEYNTFGGMAHSNSVPANQWSPNQITASLANSAEIEQQKARIRFAQDAMNLRHAELVEKISIGDTINIRQPEETEMPNPTDEVLPDISLTRVFKWALVLLVAMGLGKRVWEMFGDKVTANLHKALGSNLTPEK